jgi:hypothetical protein
MPAVIVDELEPAAVDALSDSFSRQKFMRETKIDLAHLIQSLQMFLGQRKVEAR